MSRPEKEGRRGGRKGSGRRRSGGRGRAEEAGRVEAGSEDLGLREKIRKVMEATERGEEEAWAALHDSDYDPERAVDLIIEGLLPASQWSSITKKKRAEKPKRDPHAPPPPSPASPSPPDNHPFVEEPADQESSYYQKPARGKGRLQRGGPPKGLSTRGGSGWKGRENKENERNGSERVKKGPSPSPSEAGDEGPTIPPRTQLVFVNKNFVAWQAAAPFSLSSFYAALSRGGGGPETLEELEEEYTGSLSDTKVFTPSTQVHRSSY